MSIPRNIDKFHLNAIIGSYGPRGVWSTYQGKFDNIEKCAIFHHSKDEWRNRSHHLPYDEHHDFLELDVKNLIQLQHQSNFLSIFHPVISSGQSLIFASELILGNLVDYLCRSEQIEMNFKEYHLCDEIIRLGIYQICLGLQYLHNKFRVAHGNICPEVILIDAKFQWKIAGLFSNNFTASNKHYSASNSPAWLYNLDFCAPEVVHNNSYNLLADSFSLGLLLIALYNDGNSPLASQQSQTIYNLQTRMIQDNVDIFLDKLPTDIYQYIPRFINLEPQNRITIDEFLQASYFQLETIQILTELTNGINQNVNTGHVKSILLSVLQNLSKFGEVTCATVIFQEVIKLYTDNIWDIADITNEIVTSIIEIVNPDLIHKYMKETLLEVFDQPHMDMIIYIHWLNKTDALLDKLDGLFVAQFLIPLWLKFLTCSDEQYYIMSLKHIANFTAYLSEDIVSKSIFPALQNIFSITQSIEVKNQVLESMDKLLSFVNADFIKSQVYPFIESVSISKSNILQNIINIYTHLLVKKDVLNIEILATKITPTLLEETVNESIKPEEFRALIDLINMIFDRISQDRILHYQIEDPNSVAQFSIEEPSLSRSCSNNVNNNALDNKRQNLIRNNPVHIDENITFTIPSRRLSDHYQPKKQDSQPLLLVSEDISARRRYSNSVTPRGSIIPDDNKLALVGALKARSSISIDKTFRRQSGGNASVGAGGTGSCFLSGLGGSASRTSSRRPSHSDLMSVSNHFGIHSQSHSRTKLPTSRASNENLGLLSGVRRSSFNSLSTQLMDIFR